MKKLKLLMLFLYMIVSMTMFGQRFIPWETPRMPIPGHFPNTDQVLKWMEKLAKDNPDYIKLVPYGKSFRNQKSTKQNLLALEIYHKDYNPKINAFLNGGIHPRELMTVYCTILWVDKLLQKIKNNNQFWIAFLKQVRLIVIPLLNPDGYDMVIQGWNWRKNTQVYRYRSPKYSPNSYGVDLNRNFPKFFVPIKFSFHYTWGGPKALSEPETKALANYLNDKKLAVSLSLHSFGRYMSFPWFSSIKRIPTYDKHVKVIKALKKLMPTYSFRQGTGYYANGNFGDWIYNRDKCLTFSIEIGDTFNPNKKTSLRWYKQIEKGMFYIISKALNTDTHLIAVE